MILIADSGSTKTDWIVTDEAGNRFRHNTIGYNPYFLNTENIYNSIAQNLIPQLTSTPVKTIYFYGAGCSTLEKSAIVARALSRCFPKSEVYVEHDMLGAARALLGNNRGFAAIIGTGSNTCVYNGHTIEKNIDSLGYLLGDEGSGSYIGKKIIQDYMRGYLPADLHEKFKSSYPQSHAEIYDSLYNKLSPNRFLAGFCKFADQNKEHPYIKGIVSAAFNDFFRNLVTKYPDYQNYSVNCVGSVAYIFKDLLAEVAEKYSMKVGKMICSPIDDLATYHLQDKVKNSNI